MTRPTFPVALDDAQRETLRRAAAGRPVSGGVPATDVDVDAVIGRQLTRDQLRELTPGEVKAAGDEGRLLGVMTPTLASSFTPPAGPAPEGRLTREELRTMAPAAVEAARQSGELDHLMGPR